MIPLRSLTSALFRTVPITAIATTTRTSSPVIVRKKRKSNIMMWSTTAAAMTAAAAATATATTTTLFYYSFIGGVSSLSSLSSSQSLADSTSTSACSFSSLLLLSSSASSLALKNVISSVSSSASVSQASASSLYATLINTLNANTTNCQEGENAVKKSTNTTQPPFDDSVLSYDHYNGVTIHLDKYHHQHQRSNNDDDSSGNQLTTAAAAVTIEIETLFSRKLKDALQIWKSEGKKGIWIHTNSETSKYIPICIELGFQFHKILPSSKSTTATTATTTTTEIENEDNNLLVLSQWLPDTRSRLPLGPTHQIGVGVIVLNPLNHSQILVVKEKSGPAAAYDLWKMPTGLLDPNEYVHEGAKRELYEETSLNATLNNIISIRQSHRGNGSTSDMFFVCLMELDNNDINTNDDDNGGNGGNDGDGQQQQQQQWKACEDEIADIQWMSVEEYCNQTIWNNSPLSETLNACVLQVSKNKQQAMIGGSNNVDSIDSSSSSSVSAIEHYQLEVGFGRTDKKTDALFVPKTIINSTPTSLRSDHNNNHLNSSKL